MAVFVGVRVGVDVSVRVAVDVNVAAGDGGIVDVSVLTDVFVGVAVGMDAEARKLNASTSFADKPQVLPSK